MLIQRRRDTQAALRVMRKLLKKLGFAPKLLVTDKLGSYGSAFRQLRLTNDISSLGPYFGSSEPKQSPRGKTRLPSRETGSELAPVCTPPVAVTMPFKTRRRV